MAVVLDDGLLFEEDIDRVDRFLRLEEAERI